MIDDNLYIGPRALYVELGAAVIIFVVYFSDTKVLNYFRLMKIMQKHLNKNQSLALLFNGIGCINNRCFI